MFRRSSTSCVRQRCAHTAWAGVARERTTARMGIATTRAASAAPAVKSHGPGPREARVRENTPVATGVDMVERLTCSPTRSASRVAAGWNSPAAAMLRSSILNAPHWASSGVGRHRRVRREFLALLGEQRLGFRRREELDEPDRLGPVLRVRGHAGARDVDVHARALLVRPERTHREVRVLRQEARQVVVVGDRDVALAGGDGLEDLGVAVDQRRLVRHPGRARISSAFGSPCRLIIAAISDWLYTCDGAPQAQAPLPLGVAERGVRGQLLRLHALGVVHDRAGADGQPEPAVLRDRGGAPGCSSCSSAGVHHGQQPGLGGLPEVPGVDRDQHVGRRLVALGLEPLEQLGVARVQDLQGDPGLLL